MEAVLTVTVKEIKRKVSNLENVYHEITIIEKIQPDKDSNEIIERVWSNIYTPIDIPTNLKEDLTGKEAKIVVSFYPVKRQVGDKQYININCHIKQIKAV